MRISPTTRFMAKRLIERLAAEETRHANYSRRWDPKRKAEQSRRMRELWAIRKAREIGVTAPNLAQTLKPSGAL